MYTPRTSVEAIPNASIHHSALQNRDFGHTYDRSRALVRALERRVSRFYTICDKNRLLNTNIEKVTAVLVLRSWDAVPLGQVVPPGSDARWSLES